LISRPATVARPDCAGRKVYVDWTSLLKARQPSSPVPISAAVSHSRSRKYGAKVACNDLNLEASKAAVRRIERNGGTGLALTGDVSVKNDAISNINDTNDAISNINETLDAFGRIDIIIIINNATWLHAKGILEDSLEEFNCAVPIAVNGAFLYTKHGALAMIDHGIRGSVVNILSCIAWQGAAGFIAYATHKGGLASFTRATAMDLAAYGIRVNSFSPAAPHPDNTELLIAWLSSDYPRLMTGCDFAVDGGTRAKHWSFIRHHRGCRPTSANPAGHHRDRRRLNLAPRKEVCN
jgi:NAD(P)-dependent dehydrogenase (short-subunit alcohol dehydrogenase family)